MRHIIGSTAPQIVAFASELGEPAYRGRQIAEAAYRRAAREWESLTELPYSLRGRLSQAARIGHSVAAGSQASSDGTEKVLVQFDDGERVEAVYLPYPDRVSVCISSQAGCAAGCRFCATALGGFSRNLTAGEIADQVLLLQSMRPERRISHVVYMGMGEPFFNYGPVIESARILSSEVGISARRITVSTVGVPEGIRSLACESLPITLAVSLHAPDDELRRDLIPTARKWPLAEILDACREYRARSRRDLTFEYLLLGGVNDGEEQARDLAALLKGIPGNVNLIPFNYVETDAGFRRPERDRVTAFRAALERAGRATTQRMERGRGIAAACGQLRLASARRAPERLQAAVV